MPLNSSKSRALSGKTGVSEENRLRIQETAKAMGYTIQQNDPSHCMGQLLAGTFPAQSVISLKQRGLPLVLIDHSEPLVEVDSVLNSNLDAGKMACQRLLSGGAKRIIFIGDDQFAISFKERWWGCRMALEDMAGPTEHYHLKKWQLAFGQPHMLHQLDRKVAALTQETVPDGFVCANDHLALSLMPILKRNGFDVPGRVKVIGLDNIEAAAYANPPLSTIELGKESLGIRAVETLLYRLNHPGRQTEKVVLSSRFIARESG